MLLMSGSTKVTIISSILYDGNLINNVVQLTTLAAIYIMCRS